jgi:hypothetical protein
MNTETKAYAERKECRNKSIIRKKVIQKQKHKQEERSIETKVVK